MWVTGVRRDQTSHRAAMGAVSVDGQGVRHVRPMLAWTAEDVAEYAAGSGSAARGSRWAGMQKSECGLHT